MKIKWNMHILKINLSQTDHIEIWLILITKFGKLIQFWRNILQRSGCDKGRFWPNLRNCLYRYNIKHNHWKVRIFFFYDFTLSFVAYQRKWRRVQLIIGNSNMVVLFYISCIVFSTKCYILCMYALKIIIQFSMVAYSIFV